MHHDQAAMEGLGHHRALHHLQAHRAACQPIGRRQHPLETGLQHAGARIVRVHR